MVWITVNENYDLDEIIPRLKAYTTEVVEKLPAKKKKYSLKVPPKSGTHGLLEQNVTSPNFLNERGCYMMTILSGTGTGRDPERCSGRNHAEQSSGRPSIVPHSYRRNPTLRIRCTDFAICRHQLMALQQVVTHTR